jgi:hypothetical protein
MQTFRIQTSHGVNGVVPHAEFPQGRLATRAERLEAAEAAESAARSLSAHGHPQTAAHLERRAAALRDM